jgi:ABC-type glycerol-3-phosphate transport system substrate-binding protein
MKNKFKKIIGVILSIAFLSAGCGGGGQPAPKQIVLNFWKPFEDSSNIEPIISAYQQKYPNVRIVYTKKNIDNYEQDLINALAAGQGPDIFSINNSWLPAYMDKVTPAPDKILTYKDFKDAFVDVVEKDFSVNQKVYGVAMSVDSLGLYYNKDILGTAGIATPPKTWSELATDVQKIKKADSKGYFTRSGVAIGTNNNVNRAVDVLALLMLQRGAVPFAQDGSRPTFGQNVQKEGNYINPGLEGLNFYTSFADPATPNYNWNSRSDYSVDAFANGRAGMMYSYAYMADTIRQKNSNLNFDVAVVPQPNLDDPTVNFANYWGEVVSKQSKNSDAAWSFLRFLASKDSLDKYYAKHKQPSSRKDLIALQIQDPEIGVFANANLTAKSFYKPDQAKMDAVLGRMIDNIILKNIPSTQALGQGEQEAMTLVRR